VEDHCFVKRQPCSAEEALRVFMALDSCCVQCVRYAGSDPAILTRITDSTGPFLCDQPLSPDIPLDARSRAHFKTEGPIQTPLLLDRFLTRLDQRFARLRDVGRRFEVREVAPRRGGDAVTLSWKPGEHHYLELYPQYLLHDEWMLVHDGPRALSGMIAAWLDADAITKRPDWRTPHERACAGPRRRTPW